MSDPMNEFRRLAGLAPLFEDRGLTEKTKFDAEKIVKSAMKTLGVSGMPLSKEDPFSTSVYVPGRPSPFAVVYDSSPQTSFELLWFEVQDDAYDKIKGLLPPHTVKKERGGMIIAHPKGSFSVNQ
jgi:hypothetical protein